MKPIAFNRFSLLLSISGLLFSGPLFSQTVEINPAGAIPAAYTLAQGWEWDTDGSLESWVVGANQAFVLESGTPIAGIVTGTSALGTLGNADATFTSPITTIPTPYRVIVEIRIKKPSTDTSRIDLFWDDAAGSFGGPRVLAIQPEILGADDTFKVVRVTFPYGKVATQLDRLRLDPAAIADQTVEIDYVRVYTETRSSLEWDTDTFTPNAQGGSGTWDVLTSNLWWDGATNTTWPATDTFAAIFGGTAGTATITPGGVNASIVNFTSPGYVLDGGTINLGSDSAVFYTPGAASVAATVPTRINSGLTGTAPLTLRNNANNGSFILAGSSPSYSGATTFASSSLGIANDAALGTGTAIFGAGGNFYINALDGDRTIANNVVFAGNRMLIDNSGMGSGLGVGNLTINGNLALNGIAPGDLYLRKNLTVNGVVSGSNSNVGILLVGDAGTLTLTGANTFTGNIRWTIDSVVAANADAALGAAANTLNFNAGAGALRALAPFDSARSININGGTQGIIDTNSFDMELSGTITGSATLPAQAKFVKSGTGTLTLTGTGSVIQGGLRVLGGTVEIPSGDFTYNQWDGGSGVAGNAELLINGGTLTTNNSYLAVGNGTNPADTALFTITSGTFIQGLELLTAQNGNGTFTISGGLANLNQLSFGDGPDASRTAIINLDGGTVSMNRTNRRGGSASATINFNGAAILAESNQTDFLRGDPSNTTYFVRSGGAIINSGTHDLGIQVPLQAGSPSGGLIKRGTGSLTLAANNSYSGNTTVESGNLIINGDNSASAATVNADAGLGGDGTISTAIYEDGSEFPWTVANWSAAPMLDAGTVNIPGALTVVVDENALANFTDANATFTILNASSLTVTSPAQLTVDASGFTSGSGTWSVQPNGNTLELVYTTAVAGGYADWADDNAGGQTADLDFDNDGVSNGVEYFMGETGTSFTPNPGIVAGTITWPKDSGFVGTFKVQVSDSLATDDWTDIVPPDARINESNPNEVIFSMPDAGPKNFARLSVTPTP